MIELFTLSNGVRVALERLPHLRSVSMGVWVRAGSILESAAENGLSHFMEHMAFKGTARRSALDISREMDAVGGYLNAATGKLNTCYYAKVIDEDIELAADLLSDIVRFPVLDPKELDKERNVVLEEIAMTDDSPEDVVYDLLDKAMFGNQTLGQTILGPREKIEAFTREDMLAFRQKHYTPGNTVVALAGNFDTVQVRELMEKYFGTWEGEGSGEYPVSVTNASPCTLTADKDTEQVHISLGYRGLPIGSRDNFAMAVFNSVLGGGMSSRLFQKIREESAMAYSVYSAPSAFPSCGSFTVYAAVSPKNVKPVLTLLENELNQFCENGMTEEEFRMAKAQLKGGFILSQESAYNRMNSAGGNLALMNKVHDTDEIIHRIEAVTREDANRIAREVLSSPCSRAFVGKKIDKLLR